MPPHQPPAFTSSTTIASVDSYAEALAVTNYINENGKPPGSLGIAGSDLSQLEQPNDGVALRLTLAGAGNGAWIGALVGVLITLFAASASRGLGVMFWAIVYGLLFGAVRGFIQGLARNRPGARRWESIVATRFDVLCRPADASIATQLLAQRSREHAEVADRTGRPDQDTRAA
jgi:hypothetical protein